ncbi:MAG: YheC/YheD family protein [Firmicutes bacterium]|nr:YheC/YheD family protein [Bacillota bacterium]
MTAKAQIGLLTPFFRPIEGYQTAAVNVNIDLVVVTPNRINWQTNEVDALLYNGHEWVPSTVPIPKAIYNRYYGPKPKVINRLELIIGKNKVFNHITRFDKWKTHEALASSALKSHLPNTVPYDPEHLKDFLGSFGEVILKPARGQCGKEIYLLKVKQGIYHLHQGTKSPVASFHSWHNLLAGLEVLTKKDFLLQKFIPLATFDGRIFDVRLLLQKDGQGDWQVSGALTRLALRYSYVTNICHAIVSAQDTLKKVFPADDIMSELERISIEAARSLEEPFGSLGELSVDFGLDQQAKTWIIELNAKPMKSLFGSLGQPQLMSAIYEQPLRYALHLATT